jgi:tetraacyldisaccharide 4'-kinase
MTTPVKIFFSWLLLPFAWAYGGVMRFRNFGYTRGWRSSYRAPFRVISVGNISTGGTGKTPFAEWLLREYAAQQISVAYLSRGYGRVTRGFLRVAPTEAGDTTAQYGDEAFQVAAKFPHIPVAVCESRTAGLQLLQQQIPPLAAVILDDAFQHRKVQRDVNIVMIDASRMPTRDHVLPAGRLREPLAGIRRADVLVVNKVKSAAEIPALRSELAVFRKPLAFCTTRFAQPLTFSGHSLDWEILSKSPVFVFSGIGNNAFFRSQIEAAAIAISGWREFRDHQPYTPADLQAMLPNPVVLTTEKDFRRIMGAAAGNALREQIAHWVYLPIAIEWLEGEDVVRNAVFEA